MERFDVAVVGGGPAGSTTAYRLATAGLRVVVCDRARFPRDKPCGGGLTWRAVRLLPFPVEEVVEEVVDHVVLRFGYRRAVEHHAETPYVLMTQRRRLDRFLLERARAAGAHVVEERRVRSVEPAGAGWSVRWDGGSLHADVVVGADGANGACAASLRLGGRIHHGVALEGNLADPALLRRFHRRALIEFDVVPGGYAWVFPKEDHLNFGVGGWGGVGPRLRASLADLCAAHGVALEALDAVRGWRLPVRTRGTGLARGSAVVVGDAAGMVDPLSGDGMFEAFLTGRLAAEAIVDLHAGRAPDLGAYPRAVGDVLSRHWATTLGAKLAVDRFPRAAFAVAASRVGRRGLARYLHGSSELPGPPRHLLTWRAAEIAVRRVTEPVWRAHDIGSRAGVASEPGPAYGNGHASA